MGWGGRKGHRCVCVRVCVRTCVRVRACVCVRAGARARARAVRACVYVRVLSCGFFSSARRKHVRELECPRASAKTERGAGQGRRPTLRRSPGPKIQIDLLLGRRYCAGGFEPDPPSAAISEYRCRRRRIVGAVGRAELFRALAAAFPKTGNGCQRRRRLPPSFPASSFSLVAPVPFKCGWNEPVDLLAGRTVACRPARARRVQDACAHMPYLPLQAAASRDHPISD